MKTFTAPEDRVPPHATSEPEDVEFWREKAAAAERRAQFAELRARALEAEAATLSKYIDGRSHRSKLAALYKRGRQLSARVVAAVKRLFTKANAIGARAEKRSD